MDVLRAIDAEEREPSNQYRPRIYLDHGNPMEFYDEDQFIARFRLSKDTVMELVRLLQGVLSRVTMRSHALPVPLQVCAYLRFMATGHFQRSDGDLIGRRSKMLLLFHAPVF